MYLPPTMVVAMTLELPVLDDASTVRDVLAALNKALGRAYDNGEERFGRAWDIDLDDKWFKVRQIWMVVFFVEGASEGHYVHVDTMNGYDTVSPNPQTGTVRHLFTLKTFGGYQRAQEIQKIAQFLLTAGTGA